MTSTPATAQNFSPRSGFWAGLDLGAGRLEQSFDANEIEDTTFYLGIKGGYWLSRNILGGIELNGWLLQSSNLNDPTVGEGIGQAFLISHFYPGADSNFFVKLGGGYASHWNNRPGEPGRKDGLGLSIGCGYDVHIDENWAITPFITYTTGETDDEDYKVLTFGAGFSIGF